MKDETIDNQQEMLNQAELGWLAGIIDGEGSITMNVRKKQWNGWNGIGVDLKIQIVNTDGGIVERAVNILNKFNVKPYLFERDTVKLHKADGSYYQNQTKTIISVCISRMTDILRVLTNIQPLLAGEKKSRATLIIQFIERRLNRQTNRSKGGATWYDGYDWNIVKNFYDLSGGKLLPEVKQFLNDHTQSQPLVV